MGGLTEGPAPAGGRPLLQIAPMLDVSYRDFRYFMRLLTRRAQLWTEMIVDDTVLHNLEPVKCDRFLGYHQVEHPVVCQVGGSDPVKLAAVAPVVERYGYDEINLNCGCPSDRVSRGEFGCSLMKKKDLVRNIVHGMARSVQIPVTVKCRLGVDDFDSQEFTKDFISTVAASGCKHFIIHARKAWLHGLSPAQNRSVPPLNYARVKDLCRSFPDLRFSLNGGIGDVGHARALLGFPCEKLQGEADDLVGKAWMTPGDDVVPPNLQGVMIGRGAMNNPMMLWDVDRAIYGLKEEQPPPTRRSVLRAYCAYLQEVHPPHDEQRAVGTVHMALKPTLGVFCGKNGHRVFRSAIDSLMRDAGHRLEGPGHVLELALAKLEEANDSVLDEPLASATAYRHEPRPPAAAAEAAAAARDRKRKRGAAEEALAVPLECPADAS